MSEQSPTVTYDAVLSMLEGLQIPHEPRGPRPQGPLRFASLRSPVANGLYYAEPGAPAVLLAALEGPGVVLAAEVGEVPGMHWLLVPDPQYTFYRLMQAMGAEPLRSGVHPSSVVMESRIHPTVEIGPLCVVDHATVGEGARLVSHVDVRPDTTIGPRCTIEPHATIGATGVAWVWQPDQRSRIRQPQVGGVVLGPDVLIGAGSVIVRGSTSDLTVVGEGTLIAPGSCVGHGCVIGCGVHIGNNVALGGNVSIGAHAFLGSGAVVRPWVTIPEDTVVGAGAVVVHSPSEPGQTLVGNPARPLAVATDHHPVGVPRRPPRHAR